MGTEPPPEVIRKTINSKREISRLRIIFPVEVHGDGDTPEVIRKTTNSKREIAGLRIIFLIEIHGDGDTPSLYTQ